MKLHTSLTSPFGHKCRLVVQLANIVDRVEIVQPDLKSEEYAKLNPLAKVPALELNDDRTLINSPLISAYLASQSNSDEIYPVGEKQKWDALNMEAISDGITEAAVLVFMEGMRPEQEQSVAWIDRQRKKIKAGLAVLEAQASGFGDDVHIGLLSLAALLCWFDLRGVVADWRAQYPNLSVWSDGFFKRDFYQAAEPD